MSPPWGTILRRWVRRGGARLGGRVLGCRWLLRDSVPVRAEPRRILVVRVDERVGNVLLTTPLLTALREAFPRARVDVLVAASKRMLVDGIANVVPFERRNLFVRPWAFFSLLYRLRKDRYDVAVDASHWHQFSTSSAMLLAWSAAPMRIAHERGDARLYATHVVSQPREEQTNEIAAKLRLLEPLGLVRPGARMSTRLGTGEDVRRGVERWLEGFGLADRRLVSVAPGARKQDHRLSPGLFGGIAREALRLGACPVVLWGPGERSIAAEVAALSGALLAPPTSLDELAAFFRSSAAVLTNDTGPMHLSVACGAPTVALFVRSDHHRWGHAYAPNVVIPVGDQSAEEVLRSAAEALSKILRIG